LAIRGRGEWEIDDVLEVHRLQLQYNALDRHSEDLWVRKLGEVSLIDGRGVKPPAVTRASTARTTGTLFRTGLADPTDLKTLNPTDGVISPFL
jgi:hypothetical protein